MKVSKVCDANVYVNNASAHGQASEVTCPNITAVMTDYKALGMVGSMEFFNGFDKMEMSIKWTYPENDIKKLCANFRKPIDFMVRGNKAVYEDGGLIAEIPVVLYFKGTPKQHEGGTYKPKEDTELNTTFTVTYYKEEVDGVEIVELDVYNNIYKVDGVDQLADYRQNLGI